MNKFGYTEVTKKKKIKKKIVSLINLPLIAKINPKFLDFQMNSNKRLNYSL